MRMSPRQCSLPMALPYQVHIWHLPPRILTWWISSLSLICKPERAIQDPFPYCNPLIASKLYQWAELFCLLCFHPPFWCFSLEHFGSSTDFGSPWSMGCVLWHISECSCNATTVQTASHYQSSCWDVCKISMIRFAPGIRRVSGTSQMADALVLSAYGIRVSLHQKFASPGSLTITKSSVL